MNKRKSIVSKALVNKTEKEFKPIGDGADREFIICSFCRKLTSEDEIIKTKSSKYACENCYDPADPEQNEEGFSELELNKEKSTEKTSNKTFSNTFSSESKNIS